MNRNTNSRLYVIEGADGTGKDTQAVLLAKKLGAQIIGFPRYATPVGEIIDDMLHKRLSIRAQSTAELKSEPHLRKARMLQALFLYDRMACLELWDQSRPLVLVRYWPSAWVYGGLDGLDQDELLQVHKSLPMPHVSILLHATMEERLKRMEARGLPKSQYEEQKEFMLKVSTRYFDLWINKRPAELGGAAISISAMGTVEEVHQRILETAVYTRNPFNSEY